MSIFDKGSFWFHQVQWEEEALFIHSQSPHQILLARTSNGAYSPEQYLLVSFNSLKSISGGWILPTQSGSCPGANHGLSTVYKQALALTSESESLCRSGLTATETNIVSLFFFFFSFLYDSLMVGIFILV